MQSLKWTSFLDYVTKNKTTTNSTVFQSGKVTNTFRMARMQGGKNPASNMKLATTEGAVSLNILRCFPAHPKKEKKNIGKQISPYLYISGILNFLVSIRQIIKHV